MSNAFDSSGSISAIRAAQSVAQHRSPAMSPAHEPISPEAVAPADPAYKIKISPEAKAALENIRQREQAISSEDTASRAREVAVAAGVSQSEAQLVVQSLRSPPPAKGVAIFQVNLASGQ